MGNKNLFDKVKKLNLPIGSYALFGSSPMGIRGLKECNDIDIIVTEELWHKKEKEGRWQLKISGNGNRFLALEEIELFYNWCAGDWDLAKIIKEAEIIDGLPFVKLETVLEWKRNMGREKDFKDIKIIEDYLKNQKL